MWTIQAHCPHATSNQNSGWQYLLFAIMNQIENEILCDDFVSKERIQQFKVAFVSKSERSQESTWKWMRNNKREREESKEYESWVKSEWKQINDRTHTNNDENIQSVWSFSGNHDLWINMIGFVDNIIPLLFCLFLSWLIFYLHVNIMQYYYMRRFFSILFIWSATNIVTEAIKRFHFLDEQIHEIFITTEFKSQYAHSPLMQTDFRLIFFLFALFLSRFNLFSNEALFASVRIPFMSQRAV